MQTHQLIFISWQPSLIFDKIHSKFKFLFKNKYIVLKENFRQKSCDKKSENVSCSFCMVFAFISTLYNLYNTTKKLRNSYSNVTIISDHH